MSLLKEIKSKSEREIHDWLSIDTWPVWGIKITRLGKVCQVDRSGSYG